MFSSIDQIKHLIPRTERPAGFEMSEQLILEAYRSRKELRDSVFQFTSSVLPKADEAEQQAVA